MNLKQIDKLYGILVVTGATLMVVGLLVFDNLTLSFLGLIPTCIGLFIVEPKARCPHCGRHIRLKFSLPSNCPYCRKPLE